MDLFELVVALLFAGAFFALWGDRVGVPYPALLALAGAIMALVPGSPGVGLDPDLALALFVAPTLLDAAYDASPRDLRRNIVSVVSLAVVLVALTIAAVAWAARLVLPDLGLAPAIALGAIVAPPDASAATAVLRKLQPPHRLLVILEGESLFNDATSLLVYRVAVGAAMTGAFSAWSLLPTLLVTVGGGVLAGWALARVQIRLAMRVEDVAINVLLGFVGTFGVWIIAERLGMSPIITVVVFAMTLGQSLAANMNARRRIASYAVWDVAVLVLNVLAFVLVGLQLRDVASRVRGEEWRTYALCAVAVCAAVVLVRIAWIAAYAPVLRWWRIGAGAPASELPTFGTATLGAWCGMRGIVTLAAALALPSGFPHRDPIVFSAFCVVLFTLILQGLTLRPLMIWLGLHDDGTVAREVELARAETARAALVALGQAEASSIPARILRAEYQARLETVAEARADAETLAELQRRAVDAQRSALRDLRRRRVIGDDALHVVEEELDLLELTADVRIRPGLGS